MIEGNFKMRFVGRPDGKLMKGAPGNYIHGQTYMQPYKMSQFPFWELVDEVPEIQVPDEEESFEEAYYVPDEDAATIEVSEPYDPEFVNTNSTDDAVIEPYASYDVSSGQMKEYEAPPPVEEAPEVEEELAEGIPSRKELKKLLDKAGVEYNTRARTDTLLKLVEELDKEED